MDQAPRIWLDYLFPAVLLIPTLMGLWAGFVRQLLPLVGLGAAFALAARFHEAAGRGLERWIHSPPLATAAGFGAILVAVWIAFRLVALLVERLLEGSSLTGLNRALGGLFGFAKGALLAVAIAYGIQLLAPQDHPQVKGSLWYGHLLDFAETTLRPLLPQARLEALQEHMSALRERVERMAEGAVNGAVGGAVHEAIKKGVAAPAAPPPKKTEK
ncbi:MAG: CvpA family protein [Myxococcales bacterium]|nr:CvpA family protein [Myxococcales bacterium]